MESVLTHFHTRKTSPAGTNGVAGNGNGGYGGGGGGGSNTTCCSTGGCPSGAYIGGAGGGYPKRVNIHVLSN